MLCVVLVSVPAIWLGGRDHYVIEFVLEYLFLRHGMHTPTSCVVAIACKVTGVFCYAPSRLRLPDLQTLQCFLHQKGKRNQPMT